MVRHSGAGPLTPCLATPWTLLWGNVIIVPETWRGEEVEWEGYPSCLMLEMCSRARRSPSAEGVVLSLILLG